MAETIYKVKNRSASRVGYMIPEDGIRRTFAPGEVKNITHSELLKLSYQPGGKEMMVQFLQILSDEARMQLNMTNVPPEYDMSEQQVIDLLRTGSMDAFLDCLDFAPVGVIDLIKVLAVKMPLNDMNKRLALKEKTGFDVDAALKHDAESKAPETDDTKEKDGTHAPVVAPAATTRRTAANYKTPAATTTTPAKS